jgi:hypothetical protein
VEGISLEVCIAPEALDSLVADKEFMDVVSTPSDGTRGG